MTFADQMSLADARDQLRGLVDEGERCPCCMQLAKVYPRQIHSSMATALVKLYQHTAGNPGGYYEIRQFLEHRELADFAKLAYWDLVSEQPGERPDGSRRTGWWRLTHNGVAFAEGRLTVRKHARIYDGRCLGHTGPQVSIRDCLGRKFSYAELMGRETLLKIEEERSRVVPSPVVPGATTWQQCAIDDDWDAA